MKTLQEQLRFLLKNGWTLINANTVESPDGKYQTTIEKAARIWEGKLKAQARIEKLKNKEYSGKNAPRLLTKIRAYVRLLA